MSELDLSKEVDFSFPEGFNEALELLDFVPEEARLPLLAGFAGMMTMM